MTGSQNVIAEAAGGRIDPKYQWNRETPTVLVFDVNETLIDFESMNPLFEKLFAISESCGNGLGIWSCTP